MINRSRGEKSLQPVKNAAELYFQAVEVLPEYKKAMNDFLDKLREDNPGKFTGVRFEVADLKEPKSYIDKVNGDYKGKAERVCDLVRGTFVCPDATPDEVFELQEALEKAFDVLRVKDHFFMPTDTGLRNFNNSVRMPNGHVTEVQVMLEGTWKIKSETHCLMKEAQAIERQPKKTTEEIVHMLSLKKDARIMNNTAISALKTENLINPEWDFVQMAKFTSTERIDFMADDFRANAPPHHDNDDYPPDNEADANELGS